MTAATPALAPPGRSRWLRGGGCALLATAAAALAASGHPALQVLSAVAAVACGVLAAQAGSASSRPQASAPPSGGTRGMAKEIVPVWRRHLTASREEADRGVNGLLQHFSSLSDGLNEAIAAAEGNQALRVSAGAADDLLERHPQAVDTLLAPLQRLRSERRAMLEVLREVEGSQQALHRIAADLARHARHVDMVSMNAAIESNRAGQSKGGFGAISDEVRDLSVAAQSAGQQLDELIRSTTERLISLRREAELADDSDETLEIQTRVRSRELVDVLVRDLGSALEQSRRLRETSRRLRDDLDGVFVGFQFQDRLNQMLGSLHDDMDRFERWLREPHEDVCAADPAQWLKRLESTYTMQEQHAFHHGTAEIRKTAAVEFF